MKNIFVFTLVILFLQTACFSGGRLKRSGPSNGTDIYSRSTILRTGKDVKGDYIVLYGGRKIYSKKFPKPVVDPLGKGKYILLPDNTKAWFNLMASKNTKKIIIKKKIYTVDELVTSNITDRSNILVIGLLNMVLINAGPDYKGPGSGDYLIGYNSRLHLTAKSKKTKFKLNEMVVLKGKVKCNCQPSPEHICALTDVEIVETKKIYTVDELMDSTIDDGSKIIVRGKAGSGSDSENNCLYGNKRTLNIDNFSTKKYNNAWIIIKGKIKYDAEKKSTKPLYSLTDVTLIGS